MINIPVDPDTVVEKYDGSLYGQVQFDVLVELDHNDRFKSVRDVYGVDLVDEDVVAEFEKCIDRIMDLKRLENGWQDGEGLPIEAAARDNALLLVQRRPSLSGIFHVYPTLDGGILFELESNGWDLSVELLPDGKVEFYGIQIDGVDEVAPKVFSEVGDAFFQEFDERVGL